jgi:hypothetical protein
MLKVKIDKPSKRLLRTKRLKAEVFFSRIDVFIFLFTPNPKNKTSVSFCIHIIANLTIIFFYLSSCVRIIVYLEDRGPFSLWFAWM